MGVCASLCPCTRVLRQRACRTNDLQWSDSERDVCSDVFHSAFAYVCACTLICVFMGSISAAAAYKSIVLGDA